MSKEYTAASFADATGIDKEDAYNLLRFLAARGFAENLGSKRAPGKTAGRGETHYRISPTAPQDVCDLLKKVV